MIKHVFFAAAAMILASCAQGPLDYVNAFIGTEFNGHTFPNAAYPLGNVQPGPETGNKTWDYCSGYRYADTLLLGFTQNRLNGTGCPDLGDILVMPFSAQKRPDYSAVMDKSTETASPGYYSVVLPEDGIKAEMTCTPHVAFYNFKYASEDRGVYVDFDTVIGNTGKVLDSDIKVVNSSEIEGWIIVKAWVTRLYYFVISLDTPVDSFVSRGTGNAPQYVLKFLQGRKPVKMKIAMSTADIEGARKNLAAELPHWNFKKTLQQARKEWEKYLTIGTIKGTDGQKTSFYTCLYHLFLQPYNIADVDGRYNGADGFIHTSSTGRHFSTLSQWDTFRSANPFYNLFTPTFAADLATSMMDQCDEQGFLPIWALCGKENYCMIGNHSVPPLAEAALTGLVDAGKAYAAIYKSLTVPHKNSDWESYDKYGYMPYDVDRNGSVSRTLEMGYDDYCASLLAEKLGKNEDADFFSRRAGYYKNLFDPSTGLMRGRKSDGSWREPFNPFNYSHDSLEGSDYTEGNAWHYVWHVMHDVPGLMELMGGREVFLNKLDTLFVLNPSEELTGKVLDVTGLIGQYAHGNEPSHHVAYLYALAGKPDRTAEIVRQIFDEFYQPKPDGLCGNDDCGQMSAWYLFSACGFYPVDPVSGKYVFGAPQIPQVRLRLPDGKSLEIIAEGLDADHKYVESITLNGQPLEGFITRKQILAGGTLKYKMR